MSKPKKLNISRPNLVIETLDFRLKNDEFKDEGYKNEVFLKPLRSAKNLHQIRQFSFQEANIKVITTERKLSQLHQLQKDKIDLIQSLKILKDSAVQAIAEKQDEIQKLKGKNSYTSDETVEFYENQLERSKRLRQELEEERQQLHREMCSERSKYISELQEKEYLIESLYEQIQQIRHELERLQQADLMKKQKIKQLREENIQLSMELQLSNLPTTRRSDRLDVDQTNKLMSSNSAISSIPNHSFNSVMQSQHFFQSEADKVYMSEILQEMDRMHREQILELKQIYQKKIINLRDLNEIEIRMRMEESEREKQSEEYRSRSASNASKMIQAYNSPIQDQIETNLNINQMYSIEQKVEHQLETSRQDVKNLNYEIKMKNLSECPSVQPYSMNEDNESQFTIKHFQNPFRFLKNNLSSDSFDERDAKPAEQITKEVFTKQASTDIQDNIKPFDWQKTGIFAAGLFSGITLTSLVGFLIKKF